MEQKSTFDSLMNESARSYNVEVYFAFLSMNNKKGMDLQGVHNGCCQKRSVYEEELMEQKSTSEGLVNESAS